MEVGPRSGATAQGDGNNGPPSRDRWRSLLRHGDDGNNDDMLPFG